YLRTLVIVLSLPLVTVAFLVQPFVVEGRSMQPRLEDGDRILVEKVSAVVGSFQRGDIVVFRSPLDRGRRLVKRIVGLPGETVEIRSGSVRVNGRDLEEDYLGGRSGGREECGPVRLGANDYFVLGDHRSDSEDSRTW